MVRLDITVFRSGRTAVDGKTLNAKYCVEDGSKAHNVGNSVHNDLSSKLKIAVSIVVMYPIIWDMVKLHCLQFYATIKHCITQEEIFYSLGLLWTPYTIF